MHWGELLTRTCPIQVSNMSWFPDEPTRGKPRVSLEPQGEASWEFAGLGSGGLSEATPDTGPGDASPCPTASDSTGPSRPSAFAVT